MNSNKTKIISIYSITRGKGLHFIGSRYQQSCNDENLNSDTTIYTGAKLYTTIDTPQSQFKNPLLTEEIKEKEKHYIMQREYLTEEEAQNKIEKIFQKGIPTVALNINSFNLESCINNNELEQVIQLSSRRNQMLSTTHNQHLRGQAFKKQEVIRTIGSDNLLYLKHDLGLLLN